MSDNKVYETITRNFLNGHKECRIVLTDDTQCPREDDQWLVLKDMFNCLALDDESGYYTKKATQFMETIKYDVNLKKFRVTSKTENAKSRNTQDVCCVRLDMVPVLITQFEPKKDTPAHELWVIYMHYVNQMLLESRALEVLNLIDATEERLTKPFEDVLLTSAQVAKMAECRTGTQLVEILEKMGVITYKGKDIVSWEEKYFRCTKRTVKIKYNSAPELVEKVKEYMVKYNIVPYVKRKTRRKQVHCIDTGITYSCAGDANEAFGKDRDNSLISACCRGEVPSAYGHKWEYVED